MIVATLGLTNFRTDSQFESYVRTVVFPNITDFEYQGIAQAYPADITQGSPFDTGILNAFTPEFKRTAAFQGDVIFHAPRRLFLNQLSSRQNAWAYCKRA